MIDLRSDTCSQPTPAMRKTMAEAEVGDDVYGDDPTVNALEAATAELLGKQAAVYMPSGTMTNQVGIRVHTEPRDAVLFHQHAHVYLLEGGAPAAYSGVLPLLLPGAHGIFTVADVRAALGRSHPFFPSTIPAQARLVCIENTHNGGGGAVWPLSAIEEVASFARSQRLNLHLDGARLWHATVATGISEAIYAAPFDTVSVCFSKALGAPIGSCLAGRTDLIARAKRFKQKTIAVATAEERASADVRFYGTIENTPVAIRSLLRKLCKGGQRLHLAHETGPMGYNLYRLSTCLGHRCDVVAPSLIPRKAGDKVKTDRRDAMTLAQTLRAGQLTEVWVPDDEAHEAMRDLMRMRALAMKDRRKARQQLLRLPHRGRSTRTWERHTAHP